MLGKVLLWWVLFTGLSSSGQELQEADHRCLHDPASTMDAWPELCLFESPHLASLGVWWFLVNHGRFLHSQGVILLPPEFGSADNALAATSAVIGCPGWSVRAWSSVDLAPLPSHSSPKPTVTLLVLGAAPEERLPSIPLLNLTDVVVGPESAIRKAMKQLSERGEALWEVLGAGREVGVLLRPGLVLGADREAIPRYPLPPIGQSCSAPSEMDEHHPLISLKQPSAYANKYIQKIKRQKSEPVEGCPISGCMRNILFNSSQQPDMQQVPASLNASYSLLEKVTRQAIYGAYGGARCLAYLGGGVLWSFSFLAKPPEPSPVNFYFPVELHFDALLERASSPTAIESTPSSGVASRVICRVPLGAKQPHVGVAKMGNSWRFGTVDPLDGSCVVLESDPKRVPTGDRQIMYLVATWSASKLNHEPADGYKPKFAREDMGRHILGLFDAHLTRSDKMAISTITRYPFSSVEDAIRASTTEELSRLLSNMKFAPHHANERGVHLARIVLAERMLEARRASLFQPAELGPDITEDLRTFSRDGILVMTGLDFRRPKVRHRLLKVFQYAAGMRGQLDHSFTWEEIRFKHFAYDIQNQMHSDHFSSTIKVFAFDRSVTLHDGPFHYVNGTHKNSARKKLELVHRLMLRNEYMACLSPRVYAPEQHT